MSDKKPRIFWATKKWESLTPIESKLPEYDVSQLIIYETPIELPSQQDIQTGAGEQCVDGRVVAVTG